MFGLYVHGATCALLAVHSLYIGALLAPPFALLLVRCAQVWRAPLDAPLLMLLTLLLRLSSFSLSLSRPLSLSPAFSLLSLCLWAM